MPITYRHADPVPLLGLASQVGANRSGQQSFQNAIAQSQLLQSQQALSDRYAQDELARQDRLAQQAQQNTIARDRIDAENSRADLTDQRMRELAGTADQRVRDIAGSTDQRVRDVAGMTDQRVRDLGAQSDETRRLAMQQRADLKARAMQTAGRAASSSNGEFRRAGLMLSAAVAKLHRLEEQEKNSFGAPNPQLAADINTAMQEINAIQGRIESVDLSPPTTRPSIQPPPTQGGGGQIPSPEAQQAPTTQPIVPQQVQGRDGRNWTFTGRYDHNGKPLYSAESPATQPSAPPPVASASPYTPPVQQPQQPGRIVLPGYNDRTAVIQPGQRYGDQQRDVLGVTALRMQFLGYRRVVLPDGITVVWQAPDGSYADQEGNPIGTPISISG